MSTFVFYSMGRRRQLPAGHRTWLQTVQVNWAALPHPGKVSGCDALLIATCPGRMSGRSLRFVNGHFVWMDAPCGSEAQKKRICSRHLAKMNENEEAHSRQPERSLSRDHLVSHVLAWLSGSAGLGPTWKTVWVLICSAGGLVSI